MAHPSTKQKTLDPAAMESSVAMRNAATLKTELRLRRWTVFNGALLGILWIIEFHIAERHWLSTVLTYVPQHGLLLPVSIVLAVAVRRKQKLWAWVNMALLVSVAYVFLGFGIPVQSTLVGLGRRALAGTRWQRVQQRSVVTSATASGSGIRIRVMSYNILSGRRGMATLTKTIRAQNADVICLQEADWWRRFDPLPPLKKALPEYHAVRVREVATFSRYPIVSRHTHRFPAWSKRAVLETVLDVKGRRVRVFNVHLNAVSFSGGKLYRGQKFPTYIISSMRHRQQQMDVLLAALNKPAQSTSGGAPMLVAGDFNTPPRGLIYAQLSARLDDAWRQAGWGNGHSFRSDVPVVRIDYVWLSRHFQVRRAFVPRSTASDHRPLVTDLMLN